MTGPSTRSGAASAARARASTVGVQLRRAIAASGRLLSQAMLPLPRPGRDPALRGQGLPLAAFALAGLTVVGLSWAPPSAQAAFPGENGKITFSRSLDFEQTDVWVMNPDGSGQVPLTVSSNDDKDEEPAFSPDGTKIVFLSTRGRRPVDPRDIFVMNADGSGQTRVANTSDSGQPAFSPDGQRIVFVGFTPGGGNDIYTTSLDGSDQRRVTTSPGNDSSPAFSPDGRSIAFTSDRDRDSLGGPKTEIYVINADGSGEKRLTDGGNASNFSPAFSPDGNKVAYGSSFGSDPTPFNANNTIYTINADGSGQTRLIANTGQTLDPPAFSPDGTQIAFTRATSMATGTFCCREEFEIFTAKADGSGQINRTGSLLTDENAPDWGPASPPLSVSDAAVTEGDGGQSLATFTVSLSGPRIAPVSVEVSTADGSATAPGDYQSKRETLSFAPGEVNKTFTVAVNGDTLDEFDERFFVNLSNAQGAPVRDGQGVGTIRDDDPRQAGPSPVSIGDVAVSEGDSGQTDATFAVSLSQTSDVQVTVDYATANDTATAPDDYAPSSGTVTFAPGEVNKTVTVAVKGDIVDEPDERFLVNLSNPQGATIADGQGTGTIRDDDGASSEPAETTTPPVSPGTPGPGGPPAGGGPPGDPGPGGGGQQGGGDALEGCAARKTVIVAGAGDDSRLGTLADDLIFAGTGNDVIDALAGDDCVDLGPGADLGEGGPGADLVVGAGGADRVSGSAGNDRLRGNAGRDRVRGERGNDRLFGGTRNDALLGGLGNDVLVGQSGRDRIVGSRGRDRISGGRGGDRLAGESSPDRINGGPGNDRIRGGSARDVIRGDSGNDRLTGDTGRDRIFGGTGNDRILAVDRQRDRIRCGVGFDRVTADRTDRISRDCEQVRRR